MSEHINLVIAIRFDTLGVFGPHIQAMELSSVVVWQPLLAAVMAAVIAVRSWKKNSLSGSGAVTGFVLLALSLGAGPRLEIFFHHPCSHFASPTSTNMPLLFLRVSRD